MLNWKRFIVPLDFDESSGSAIASALALAKRFEAEVIAFHAYEIPSVPYFGASLARSPSVAPAIAASAQDGLDAAVARIAATWPNVSGILRCGTTWREIAHVAAERCADLVVMGTHGRHGLAHALLGSVAARVVRSSPVPVLTIQDHAPPINLPLRRILVATDFSETASAALDYAIDIAEAFDASIALLYAYELPLASFPDGVYVVSGDVAARIGNVARDALAHAVEARGIRSKRIERVLREDTPWRAIVTAADDLDASLVVLGTHGRTGVARALMGSVAEKVVRESKRPVLTVGRTRHGGSEPAP